MMNAIASRFGLAAMTVTITITLMAGRFAVAAQVTKRAPTKEPGSKAAPIDDKATWLLAGREGECAPLTIFEKKGPEYKDLKSPYQLAEKLRASGHKAEVKEFKAGVRPAVEVRAPSAGIHVMFIKQEHCDKKPPAVEKK
jgi:hypothetical protein